MQPVATGYGLIEGPVWDPARGLYYSDVANGGVYLLNRAGATSQVVPKRRGIGGMALHEKGGLVVGGRDILRSVCGRLAIVSSSSYKISRESFNTRLLLQITLHSAVNRLTILSGPF